MRIHFLPLVPLLLSSVLYANTLLVPSEYPYIQAGLDAAQQNDTVLVAPGIYYENIIWPEGEHYDNGITLLSESGPAETIIDGDSAGSVIWILTPVDSTTVISGFTIQNGYDDVTGAAGGIFCYEENENFASPSITNNHIINNHGIYGGGIRCLHYEIPHPEDSRIIIRDNIISGNEAELHGGGIMVEGGHALIQNNQTLDNTAGSIAGGVLSYEDNSAILNNEITGNSAGDDGGGIFFLQLDDSSESVLIQGNTINDNSSDWCGGGISGLYGMAYIIGNEISNNGSNAQGGGVFVAYCDTVFISNCTICGNMTTWEGGGICLGEWIGKNGESRRTEYPDLIQGSYNGKAWPMYSFITDCIVSGNCSQGGGIGGGIWADCIGGRISRCEVSDNQANWGGAGIYLWQHMGGHSHGFLIDSTSIINNIGDGITINMFLDSLDGIHYCNIYGNSGYGLNSYSWPDIDATYCWWGDPSGPGGSGPGCGDEVSDAVIYDPWLTEMGIQIGNSLEQLVLDVYPNPFQSILHASIDAAISNTSFDLQVYDLSGRTVYSNSEINLPVGSYTFEVDGSDWATGIYFLRIVSGGNDVCEKCVLIR